MRSAQILITGLLAGLLVGCADERGPTQTAERDLGQFESVDIEGAARLEITLGPELHVELEASADSLERVKTEVRGNTLHIESRPKDWLPSKGRPRVTVRLRMPKLVSLRLGGGNDVLLQGFDGGASSIKVEGAANITGTGTLDELIVHMAGAGHANFSALVARAVRVTVDGVGSVTVNSTDALDATMNGIGAIFYRGSPREVSTRVNGLGTIARKESSNTQKSAPRKSIDPDSLQPEYEDDRPESV